MAYGELFYILGRGDANFFHSHLPAGDFCRTKGGVVLSQRGRHFRKRLNIKEIEMKDFCGQIGAKLDICAILFAVLCICGALIGRHLLLWRPACKDVVPYFVNRCINYSIDISFEFMSINVAIITPIRGVVCLFRLLKGAQFSKAGTILFASAFSLQILAFYVLIATMGTIT
jgi:hypothetical protein